MKYEWRKAEKELYLPKEKPTVVEVPRQKFFMIKGQGNPNGPDFGERVAVLYSLAYAVRMMPKNGFTPEGYFEYTVYPLEGVWDLTEEGRKSETLRKDQLVYTIMIRQPDFVDENVAEKAFAIAGKKKAHPLLKEAYFGDAEDGLCVQMLHVGPFDDEPKTFAVMEAFMAENNLKRRTQVHKEIYLSDFNKTPPEKLKTVLRLFVAREG